MRYRPLDANGDYTIGVPFLSNSPQTVAQAIQTRLGLWQGQWFVDVTDGTPYLTGVLGTQYGKDPNAAIKLRILGTPGVTAIVNYASAYDPSTRQFSVSALVQTQYSVTPIALNLTLPSPAA